MTLEESAWVFLAVIVSVVILVLVFCIKEEGRKHG